MKQKLNLRFNDSMNSVLFSTQGDTGRQFEIIVEDEFGDPIDITGHKLEFYVGNDKEVTKVTATISNNRFIVKPVSGQFKYAGINKAQFVLYDPQGLKVGSQIFELYVEESIENGATVGVNVIVDFEEIKKASDLVKNFNKTLDDTKVIVAEAKTTKTAIEGSVATAKTAKSNLDNSISRANTATTNLDNSISTGNTTKSNIDGSISRANIAKSNLDGSLTNANNIHNSLVTATSTANTSITNLRGSDTKAKETLQSLTNILNQSKTTEQNLKTIIAQGDLEKYITQPELDAAIKALPTLKKEVVTTLPTTGKDDVIYLIKDANGADNNNYLEYLWINGKFELIGSTRVDLSNYALKSEIKTRLDQMTSDSTHRTVTDDEKREWDRKPTVDVMNQVISRAIENKVDKVDGKALSTNDYTNTDKNKVSHLTSSDANHEATTSNRGYMSANDKVKLNDCMRCKVLTQAQYDVLSSTDKNRADTLYFIKK